MKKNYNIHTPFIMRKNINVVPTNKDITYEDITLQNFISSWLNLRGWSLDFFPCILDILGVDKPVKLLKLKNNSFYARTLTTNRGMKITLTTKGIENSPTIELEEAGVIQIYSINFRYNNHIPLQLTPMEKIIYKNGKYLICIYSNIYHYSLTIGEYVLDIDKAFDLELPDITNKIEEYLLTLEAKDFIYDVSGIYQKIKKIQGKNSKISNNKIMLLSSKLRTSGYPSVITSKISVNSDCILTEFSISKYKNGTYHIFENGDWKWNSFQNYYRISYCAETKYFSYSIRGQYNVLENAENPNNILNKVIIEINKLKRNIGKQF